MKKITLLFLMLSFAAKAKFISGTIYYTDGNSRTGLVEVSFPEDREIKFKTSKDSKPETIESELLSSIVFTDNKGLKETLLYVYPAQEKKKGIDKEKKKYWLTVVYSGKVNFLSLEKGGKVATGAPGINYYIHNPDNDYALYFSTKHSGFVKVVGEKKLYKNMIEWHFKDICPELVAKSKSGEFETKDMDELIAFYKKTCE